MMAHTGRNGFDSIDQADLMQAVSLLGDMLSEAMVLINHEMCSTLPRVMKGMKTSKGVVAGQALPVWADIETAAEHLPPPGSIEEESALFDRVLSDSIKQLEDLQDSAASDDREMVALIFTAQMYMLKDQSLTSKIKSLIDRENRRQ